MIGWTGHVTSLERMLFAGSHLSAFRTKTYERMLRHRAVYRDVCAAIWLPWTITHYFIQSEGCAPSTENLHQSIREEVATWVSEHSMQKNKVAQGSSGFHEQTMPVYIGKSLPIWYIVISAGIYRNADASVEL